nr:hypothetical protein CFP56_21734 [Quercus suber]
MTFREIWSPSRRLHVRLAHPGRIWPCARTTHLARIARCVGRVQPDIRDCATIRALAALIEGWEVSAAGISVMICAETTVLVRSDLHGWSQPGNDP